MNTVGSAGEILATSYLKKLGYKIIEKNFRLRYGEIDIIAKDRDCICFIEVKTRTSDKFIAPFESVNKKKQKKIIALANMWLSNKGLNHLRCRFDIISLLLDKKYSVIEMEHIKDAFDCSGYPQA